MGWTTIEVRDGEIVRDPVHRVGVVVFGSMVVLGAALAVASLLAMCGVYP